MGYRGRKTVFSVEADTTFTFSPEVAVGWLNTIDEWGWGSYVPFNEEGIATNIVSSTNFIVLLKFEYYSHTKRLGRPSIRGRLLLSGHPHGQNGPSPPLIPVSSVLVFGNKLRSPQSAEEVELEVCAFIFALIPVVVLVEFLAQHSPDGS